MRPPAGRPHGAEQRRRSLHPLPRPHSAVPAPGRRGPSSGGARRDAVRARAVDGGEAVRCFRRPGGLEGPPERWRRRLPRGGGGWPSGSGAAVVPALRPPPLGAAAGDAGGARRASSGSISELI